MAKEGFDHADTVKQRTIHARERPPAMGQPQTVVLVDEAAMLDTAHMAMVTAYAHDAGAKLILVGDDRQLSIIERGGMFGVLKDRHGAATLTEIRRQHQVDDRRASEYFGRRTISRGARHLRGQGRDPLDAHPARGPRRAGRAMGDVTAATRQIPVHLRLHQCRRCRA